uniref:Uncharacterized protein n=1 Tax=Aureoumbra lagunensis TaxID=44058 RepID=A0A7S3JYB9_9STRA|mmetsp:Transcript_17999/g.23463  ORF Transcript_17999/g.23463 Transcript_17999/m.23463 type:complete len:185 (+) Transcript_17999:89-643(+)|eukprot:CAMPEP_0197294714 /NCGR_PEP_ID=MMETSP0890-20130614/33367_1 /TAXON_ID=44058 ORGANISM="Aureoumbra lagunensis, Strain CCMP1510" /NCGR_SAMPLE_ID=MMETSP0890 /ASSEMBLY_ACC=CAM_ASM_000533 /LENGTH=184 /DNA_ID=CAMNT_0042770289 /DNA_START=46 /DNA_END=600 /DNA_ORIENTATION=+
MSDTSSLIDEIKHVLTKPSSRRELQTLAKKLAIKANSKTSVIIQQLEARLQSLENAVLTDATVKEFVASEDQEEENKNLIQIQSSEKWPRSSLHSALDEEAEKIRPFSPMDIDEPVDPSTMDRRAIFLASRAANSAAKSERIRSAKRAKLFGLDKTRPTAQSAKTKPLNLHNVRTSPTRVSKIN